MKTTITTICNQKGGAGKTTTVMALAFGLAKHNKKVLTIDLDQQASLTRGFGIYAEKEADVYDWIIDRVDARKAVTENITCVPATPKGVDAMLKVMESDTVAPSNYLKDALEDYKQEYDYILVDTPPSLGLQLTNALVASNSIVIPVEPNYFSLSGYVEMAKTIERVRRVNPHLTVTGTFVNNFSNNANVYKEYAQAIKQASDALNTRLFDTKIRHSAKIAETQSNHTDFYKCPSKNPAAQDFSALVKEYIESVGDDNA